ncbi:hypothetical protein ACFOLK_02010 [Marinococcus halophilus]
MNVIGVNDCDFRFSPAAPALAAGSTKAAEAPAAIPHRKYELFM